MNCYRFFSTLNRQKCCIIIYRLQALRLRNYITHDYFRFNSTLGYAVGGKERMIKDFIDFVLRVKAIDKKLEGYTQIYHEKAGLTKRGLEKLMIKVQEEWRDKIINEEHETIVNKNS